MTQPSQRRFRVALSFPGEYRPRVEEIADALGADLGREKVLYDKWYAAEFARPNLDVYITKLYRDESDLIAVFLCEGFDAKEWCGLEWRAARHLLKEHEDRLMFFRLDDADIPGLYSIDGYLAIHNMNAGDVAAAILGRLGLVAAPSTRRTFISKLPTVDPTLVGREQELSVLDRAWSDPGTNLVQVIGVGGAGKTALVDKWFRRHLNEATVFGWSFYSQGTAANRQASSDSFFSAVLAWFRIETGPTPSIYAKAEAVASRLRDERVLLILDGVESLQDASGALRDAALKALLQELSTANRGLVVCTTRTHLDIPDEAPRALSVELDNLTPDDGAEYLRALGVQGTDEELQQASKEYWNHPLALTILGTYLVDFCEADIRRRVEIPDLMAEEAHHTVQARRVIAAYDRMFAGKPEAAILRALGYFDRPADPAALKLVLPVMEDRKYRAALRRLHQARLILTTDPSQPISCHPLVREHFSAEATHEGHSRLSEHYTEQAPYQPDTLDEMAPLCYAVYHACRAGRHESALDEIYWTRILRNENFYLTKNLGAFGTNLSLLANFFESPWAQPAKTLSPKHRSLVITLAGVSLRAVGRLADAVEPMRVAAEDFMKLSDWKNAATGYGNLSELHLTLGDLPKAVSAAWQSVELADRSADWFQRVSSRSTLAGTVHQCGDVAESLRLFAEAERLQMESQPEYPILHSLSGYRYCDLLLDQGQTREVLHRTAKTLLIAERSHWLLEIGLDHLSLGRSYPSGSDEAMHHLDQAIDFLRRAGQVDYLSLGLLARGTSHDLDEVFRIATRSGMRLRLADFYLASARRALSDGDWTQARAHLEKAELLVHETGYHRCDPALQLWASEIRTERGDWLEQAKAFFSKAHVHGAKFVLWPGEITKRATRERLYIVYPDSSPATQELLSLRIERNVEPVPISLDRISRALAEDDCSQTLRNLEVPFTERRDPYGYLLPLKNETWFYGRRDMIDNLPLLLSQGQHLGLFGLRKVGKTSLLNQLRDRVSKRTPVVYIDCEGAPQTSEYYLRAMLRGFSHELRRRGINSSDLKFDDFASQLLALHRNWRQTASREPFVLILDEVDLLFPDRLRIGSAATLAESVRFFRIIRAIAQEYGCLSLLLCAYRADINRQNFLGVEVGENPLHMSLLENFLRFLNADDSKLMVRDIGLWRDIEWTNSALDLVYELCAGHPLVTRLFASVSCDEGKRKRIDESRVAECARAIQRDFYKEPIGRYFRESIWNVLHDRERECLKRIIRNAPMTTDLEEARSNLEQFGIINERMQMQGKLFQSWVEAQ